MLCVDSALVVMTNPFSTITFEKKFFKNVICAFDKIYLFAEHLTDILFRRHYINSHKIKKDLLWDNITMKTKMINLSVSSKSI